ncbi:hypothetical protein [Desulfolutivibrio sp.]|uniref:hypothetical protein n=1 Tax=Desulfolutivibrio sp. TaxID=2773296 RepID=UPI002F9616CB
MKIAWFLIVAIALSAGGVGAQNVYDGCKQPWGTDLGKNADFVEESQVESGGNTYTPPAGLKYYTKKSPMPGPLDGTKVYYEVVDGKFGSIRATVKGGSGNTYSNIVDFLKLTCQCNVTTNKFYWSAKCFDGITAWVGNGANVVLWIENDALAAKARAYLK